MTVTLHAKEIRISVEEGSLNHLIVKNFVQKYFSNVLTLSGTLVIFHNESELSQKRYFFQWLYSAYRKKRQDISPAFLKMLQGAAAFPIRVRVMGRKKPVQAVSVRLWVPADDRFCLLIEPAGSLMVNYFRQRFSSFLLQQRAVAWLEIKSDPDALTILSELLGRAQIMAQPVTYRYEKIQLDRLLSRAQQSDRQEQKQRFFRLVIEEDAKLKEAYQLLGCAQGADAQSVKKCYRDLARRFHPDRAFSEGEAAVAEMTRRFHAINAAYELICDQARSA
ncbi:MAG: J domain-containing protein [Campylobacterales bacterium]